MNGRDQDEKLMHLAVDLARQSRPEEDGRIHPKVGAVIAHPNGEIISTGYRGRYTPGNHAEQEALIGINPDLAANSVVYSTLEPCTFRGKQTPCCLRLIDRHVAEVVIGILDPNPDIRGRGWWKFEERGIRVRNFSEGLVSEIREMNREFINYQLGPGLMITAIQPDNTDEVLVTETHRAKRDTIELRYGRISVRGIYRVKPARGDSISMFVRSNQNYYLQAPIDFSYDQENSLWRCASLYVGSPHYTVDVEIIVARISEDLGVAVRHYNTVHRVAKDKHKLDLWIGIEMNPEPPGFERLASLNLRVVGEKK